MSRRYPELSGDDESASLNSGEGDGMDESSMASADVAALLRGGGGKFLVEGPTVKELNHRLRLTRDELRLMQDENTRLRSREVEISALSLRLQQQFSATQHQVDSLKASLRLQLLNPISDEEYVRIEGLPEDRRDLLDTIKVGIYQQLGSLRSRADGAMKKCTEMASEIASLTAANKSLTRDLADDRVSHDHELGSFKRQITQLEQRGATVAELTAKVADLEARLSTAHVHQEEFINAKILASAKTNEAARLAVALKEAESDASRHKTMSECCEQKLDILKAEYYDTRLKYNQQVMELESRLRLADEKLKLMGDVELEAEIFISNMATSIHDGSMDGGMGQLTAIPPSRTLQHALVVTKRCISLENNLVAQKQQLAHKDAQIARLQQSLEHARSVLQNSNAPYVVVERTIEKLTRDVEDLQSANQLLREENTALSDRVAKASRDGEVLARHRAELHKMRATLTQLAQGHRVEQQAVQLIGSPTLDRVRSPRRKQNDQQQAEIIVNAARLDTRSQPISSAPPLLRAADGSTMFSPELIEIS